MPHLTPTLKQACNKWLMHCGIDQAYCVVNHHNVRILNHIPCSTSSHFYLQFKYMYMYDYNVQLNLFMCMVKIYVKWIFFCSEYLYFFKGLVWSMVASVVIHLSEVFQISIFLSETTAQNVSSHDRNVSWMVFAKYGFPC